MLLLAELEVYHSRLVQPTRRVALGRLVLPTEPYPGFGGLLIGAVLAAHIPEVPADAVADVHRLLDEVADGVRVVQPRLRHRFQVDRHGLGVSTHRLRGVGERVSFEFGTTGTALAQVLGAIYALERLDVGARRALVGLLHRALRWQGPIGPSFIANMAGGLGMRSGPANADARAWALEILEFPFGTSTVSTKDVMRRYRAKLRRVHPDLAGVDDGAAQVIEELAEARRILLAK